MIIGPSQRAVIEIDGQQHYADDAIAPSSQYKKYASSIRYAKMMKAHREMSLARYDVYCFGARELWIGEGVSDEDIIVHIKEFLMSCS